MFSAYQNNIQAVNKNYIQPFKLPSLYFTLTHLHYYQKKETNCQCIHLGHTCAN